MKLKDANLDSNTLKYIEYIAEAKGQKALDKYLKWVGREEVLVGRGRKITFRQPPVEQRLALAIHRAKTWRLI